LALRPRLLRVNDVWLVLLYAAVGFGTAVGMVFVERLRLIHATRVRIYEDVLPRLESRSALPDPESDTIEAQHYYQGVAQWLPEQKRLVDELVRGTAQHPKPERQRVDRLRSASEALAAAFNAPLIRDEYGKASRFVHVDDAVRAAECMREYQACWSEYHDYLRKRVRTFWAGLR
jgi:hypothetical protein